jgi:dihydrofolate synthase/folylpolyglutamate synthase
LDSAHNPNAIEEVAKFLKTLDYENLYVIFSCLKDKNAEKMLKALPPHKELIITKIHFHRAMELGDIYKAEPGVIIENVKNAMDHVKEKLQQNDLLIILGSVYLAGEVLEKQIM